MRFGSGETETDEFGKRNTPSQDSCASNSPGNQELGQSCVSLSVRKLMRNSNQDPTANSQERRRDDTLSSSTRTLVRSGESANSARTRKLERGDDIQIGRTRLEFHNMQVSDYRYLEKVFNNLRQKVELAEEAPVIGVEALKTNVLIWGLFTGWIVRAGALGFGTGLVW